MDSAYTGPLPEPTQDSQPYWDGLKRHKLLFQRCVSCGTIRHYPRPMCATCHSMELEWIESRGHGHVHSWAVTHHAFHPSVKDRLPYVMAMVDMEEGVRVNAPLRGCAPEDVSVGLGVSIAFEDVTPDVTFPAFTLA